jgi:chaperonin GroES
MEKTSNTIIEPMCGRVLIRKDDDKGVTRGGIVLPDSTKIPTITARVVAIAADIESDITIPLSIYDKVIVDPSRSIPVDFEGDNKLYIIPAEDIVARFQSE